MTTTRKSLPPIKSYHHRSRLTDELIDMIADKVEATGTLPLRVLIAAGIPEGTADMWLRIGRGEHSRYPEPPARYLKLHEATQAALHHWHNMELVRIGDGGHWRERQNVLGARFPEYRDQVAPASSDGPIAATVALLAGIVARDREVLAAPTEGAARVLSTLTDVVDVEPRALPPARRETE